MANPKPPQAVREAARKALERREEYGRGGTEVGVARARDLSNGRGPAKTDDQINRTPSEPLNKTLFMTISHRFLPLLASFSMANYQIGSVNSRLLPTPCGRLRS